MFHAVGLRFSLLRLRMTHSRAADASKSRSSTCKTIDCLACREGSVCVCAPQRKSCVWSMCNKGLAFLAPRAYVCNDWRMEAVRNTVMRNSQHRLMMRSTASQSLCTGGPDSGGSRISGCDRHRGMTFAEASALPTLPSTHTSTSSKLAWDGMPLVSWTRTIMMGMGGEDVFAHPFEV
eukprot:5591010-Amphidinium_carterae.1